MQNKENREEQAMWEEAEEVEPREIPALDLALREDLKPLIDKVSIDRRFIEENKADSEKIGRYVDERVDEVIGALLESGRWGPEYIDSTARLYVKHTLVSNRIEPMLEQKEMSPRARKIQRDQRMNTRMRKIKNDLSGIIKKRLSIDEDRILRNANNPEELNQYVRELFDGAKYQLFHLPDNDYRLEEIESLKAFGFIEIRKAHIFPTIDRGLDGGLL